MLWIWHDQNFILFFTIKMSILLLISFLEITNCLCTLTYLIFFDLLFSYLIFIFSHNWYCSHIDFIVDMLFQPFFPELSDMKNERVFFIASRPSFFQIKKTWLSPFLQPFFFFYYYLFQTLYNFQINKYVHTFFIYMFIVSKSNDYNCNET